MAKFKNISTNHKMTLTIDSFYGVNLTDAPGKISPSKSPDAINMIRDSMGKVKKRPGYYMIHDFSERIYGIYFYTDGTNVKKVIHSGKNLYIEKSDGDYEIIYSDMNEKESQAIQFGQKLMIADGKTLLYYDGERTGPISERAYVPTVVINRAPSGGGIFYEPINMIGEKRIEFFSGDGKSVSLKLTADSIYTVDYVKEFVNGQWRELEYGYNYSFTQYDGRVTLDNASKQSEEDNYEVCYRVKNSKYLEIINTSSLMTLYGVYGAMDRLFLGGNTVYHNRDYYSQMNDPTYFPDTNYSILGRDETPVAGYSLVSDKLVTYKNNELNNANMILRYGSLDEEGNALFRISGTYQGSGAVCRNCFGSIDNEPAYFSGDGICAITPSDIMGERYSQLRSYFINGKLLKENDVSSACAVSHKQFYMLLLNEKIYILDSLRYTNIGNNSFSHRQYDCYVWDNIPASILFSDGETLFFGGKNGKLYAFYDDTSDNEKIYLDDGKTFDAYWQLPKLIGDDFSKKKTVMHISVIFDDYSKNTRIQYKDGEWKDVLIKNSNSMFLSKRLHLKNTKEAEIRIINSANEPMNLNTVKLTYINGGTV